jgi:hypothetical protein
MKISILNSRSVAMLAALTLVTVILAACTSTSQMRKTKATGFLGDYSELHKGQGDEAQMVYIRPKVKWTAYNKVVIDPITAYAIPGNPLADLPKEQLNALVSYLYSAVREQLSKDYQIVDAAGPGVMRLRIALTDAAGGKPVFGVVSSVVPIGMAVSLLKTAITGSGTGTGAARVEMELLDSQSKQRLIAAVDAQSGNKRDFFGSFSRWDDARDAFDGWSVKLATRLTELRAGGE